MKSPELELKALMLASVGGDAATHRALLGRLSRHLRGYYKRHLVRSGRSAEEAEDLMQEALLAIHVKRHTFDVETLFMPWVHAVARYKLIDHMAQPDFTGKRPDRRPSGSDGNGRRGFDREYARPGTAARHIAGEDPPDNRSREA